MRVQVYFGFLVAEDDFVSVLEELDVGIVLVAGDLGDDPHVVGVVVRVRRHLLLGASGRVRLHVRVKEAAAVGIVSQCDSRAIGDFCKGSLFVCLHYLTETIRSSKSYLEDDFESGFLPNGPGTRN